MAKLTKRILLNKAMRAVEKGDGSVGFCTSCGMKHDGVEPDAERYVCENHKCGKAKVYGAEQIVLLLSMRF